MKMGMEKELKRLDLMIWSCSRHFNGVLLAIMKDNAELMETKLNHAGPTTDVAQALSSRLRNSSQDERLALLVQLVNVMKLPTVVLVGINDQHVSIKNSSEVICKLGEHLASVSSLSFSKEKIVQNPTKTSKDSKEAWRALYG